MLIINYKANKKHKNNKSIQTRILMKAALKKLMIIEEFK